MAQDRPSNERKPRRLSRLLRPGPAPTLTTERAGEYAEWFKALADPTRIRILNLLARNPEPVCVCDIVDHFELGQPTISHHLKILRETCFVQTERRGTFIYYSINRNCVDEFPRRRLIRDHGIDRRDRTSNRIIRCMRASDVEPIDRENIESSDCPQMRYDAAAAQTPPRNARASCPMSMHADRAATQHRSSDEHDDYHCGAGHAHDRPRPLRGGGEQVTEQAAASCCGADSSCGCGDAR